MKMLCPSYVTRKTKQDLQDLQDLQEKSHLFAGEPRGNL